MNNRSLQAARVPAPLMRCRYPSVGPTARPLPATPRPPGAARHRPAPSTHRPIFVTRGGSIRVRRLPLHPPGRSARAGGGSAETPTRCERTLPNGTIAAQRDAIPLGSNEFPVRGGLGNRRSSVIAHCAQARSAICAFVSNGQPERSTRARAISVTVCADPTPAPLRAPAKEGGS